MRVLMLSKACIVGIYQRKLELIAQQGVELHVLVPPSWKDERGVQYLERVYTEGYDLIETPIQLNGNFHLHWYPQLGAEIRRFQPHIVHIDEEPYNLASWHALYHAQAVTAKSLVFSWQNIFRQYPPPFRWGEKWVLDHIDHLLVGTDSAGDVWREKGYRGAMTTIPQFGTDAELFQPTSQPERPFTIGYIGRLVEEKGLLVLLDAIGQLSGDWCLRLVGGGPLQEALQSKAELLGIADNITFVGQIPSIEMPQQYTQLDVLVLPSLTYPNWKEQFGRVLVEAMASGVPVIGSDSGAIPGVVGEAGVIVPEGDVAQLAQQLQHLIDQPSMRAAYAEQGRERVLAAFTHAQIAEATVQTYQKLI